MKPWIHPQERRSRIYWWTQILIVVAAVTVILTLLLREPTRDHVLIAVGVGILGVLVLVLSFRELRKLPNQYKYEAEDQDSRGRTP
jgi:multisubunit Na+/H+ antiporter MnhB subunit